MRGGSCWAAMVVLARVNHHMVARSAVYKSAPLILLRCTSGWLAPVEIMVLSVR